jgi:hypothetical protein
MQKEMIVSGNVRGRKFLRLIVGAALFFLGILLTDIPTMIISQGWPTTEGNIRVCRLVGTSFKEYDGDIHTETKVYISYQYTVNGIPYSSSRVNSIKSPFSMYPPSYASRYPAGKDVTVFYNPKDPSEAVLEPGFVDTLKTFDVISLSILVTGIYFVLLGIFGRYKAI